MCTRAICLASLTVAGRIRTSVTSSTMTRHPAIPGCRGPPPRARTHETPAGRRPAGEGQGFGAVRAVTVHRAPAGAPAEPGNLDRVADRGQCAQTTGHTARDRLPYRGCPALPAHPREPGALSPPGLPRTPDLRPRTGVACTMRRYTWLPTATSAARARASGTASPTPTAGPSGAGTPTS